MRRVHACVLMLLLALPGWAAAAPLPALPEALPALAVYQHPRPEAEHIQPGTHLVLRLDGEVDPRSLRPGAIEVVGLHSGPHTGDLVVADDGVTVAFRPHQPFARGERVSVTWHAGLATRDGRVFGGTQFVFTTTRVPASVTAASLGVTLDDAALDAAAVPAEREAGLAAAAAGDTPQAYVTFPDDFPPYTVTVPASNTAPGLIFIAPRPGYQLIMDNTGEPVYYRTFPGSEHGSDFKVLPNGNLVYFDSLTDTYRELDSTYTEAHVWSAVGYPAIDQHEFEPFGDHAFIMIYAVVIVDLSDEGGSVDHTVIDVVIQELDSNNTLVAEWRGLDPGHFLITDTVRSLTGDPLDYVHSNAIEVDYDGNILLSSRHLNEVTKIDWTSPNGGHGDIIWRLGGKNNQFTIVNDDPSLPFSHQHDSRRLPNGNLTLFDNGNMRPEPKYSRALEFEMDEVGMVVTNTWQYTHTPDIYVSHMGNAQRLPNDNTLVGWGGSRAAVFTEVQPDGTPVFEVIMNSSLSYRSFRFPWQGFPVQPPALIISPTLDLAGPFPITTTLYFSWNGATEVAEYEIYGRNGLGPPTLVATVPRTGFEEQVTLAGEDAAYCLYQVLPLDGQGVPGLYSLPVAGSAPCRMFLPFIGLFP